MPRSVIPWKAEVAAMKITKLTAAVLKVLRIRRGYSEDTIERYERTWTQFVTYLKAHGFDDDVRAFTDDHVEAFMVAVLDQGIRPSTVVTMLHALSTLGEVGMQVKEGTKYVLSRNPTKGFEWPVAEVRERGYLRGDELAAFAAVDLESRERLARDLLIETGLRASELCRVNVEDLHTVDGKVYLSVTVKGKRSRQRRYDMPISDPLAAQIMDALERDGRWPIVERPGITTPLLLDRAGDRYNRLQLTKLMIRIGKLAGIARISVSAHTVRHTLELIRRMGDVKPELRSRLMGHANLSSIQSYTHVMPAELHAARAQQIESFRRYIGDYRPGTVPEGEARKSPPPATEENSTTTTGHAE